MNPIIFSPILFLVGLFLVFSSDVRLSSSRVLRRPNTFYIGSGVILLAVILWFVLGYIESSKNGQLMWAMPIGYILAILLIMIFSVKEVNQVAPSYGKSEIFSKSLLLIFVFLPSFIFAIVMTLVVSPVASIILFILGGYGIIKFMKNSKK